ncbi:MAG: hypothetical protein GY807_12650, partial [Gammaproteobacteria bacterium]|nr:hypothetical protein [Gammaproteobacteria bacterium]
FLMMLRPGIAFIVLRPGVPLGMLALVLIVIRLVLIGPRVVLLMMAVFTVLAGLVPGFTFLMMLRPGIAFIVLRPGVVFGMLALVLIVIRLVIIGP